MKITNMLVAACLLTTSGCSGEKPSATAAGSADRHSPAVSSDASTMTAIPGLTFAQVKAPFEKKGFTCSDIGSGDMVGWTCSVSETEYGYTIQSFGARPDDVKEISLQSLAFSGDPDKVARPFLVSGADIPYQGADPVAARKWIDSNVGTEEETRIGGVSFKMRTTGAIRTLKITP